MSKTRTCPNCSKQLANRHSLSRHKKTCGKDLRLSRDQLPAVVVIRCSGSSDKLETHTSTNHKNLMSLPGGGIEGELHQSQLGRTVREVKKRRRCPKCEKSLASRQSLWNHKRRCSGGRLDLMKLPEDKIVEELHLRHQKKVDREAKRLKVKRIIEIANEIGVDVPEEIKVLNEQQELGC